MKAKPLSFQPSWQTPNLNVPHQALPLGSIQRSGMMENPGSRSRDRLAKVTPFSGPPLWHPEFSGGGLARYCLGCGLDCGCGPAVSELEPLPLQCRSSVNPFPKSCLGLSQLEPASTECKVFELAHISSAYWPQRPLTKEALSISHSMTLLSPRGNV